MRLKLSAIALVAILSLFSCKSSEDIKDALDLVDDVPRKEIDTSTLGTNAFVNDGRFGNISAQFNEIKNTLRLKYVRVLIQWDDNSQPSPSSSLNLSFVNAVLGSIPSGVDALVILTGAPSWMANPANWVDGDAGATFVQKWVEPIVSQYGDHPRIVGFEVWNEPNDPANTPNNIMGFVDNPVKYVAMLSRAYSAIKAHSSKLVLSAATTAINQNYPDTLNYNRAMRDAGAPSVSDVWAVHYYGRQFENVVRSGGVADFLNQLGKIVWVTETGAQGVNEQLKYAQQVLPYLKEKIPGIARFYQYQFTESTPADSTYGLRNLTPGSTVSDLYIHLRDR